MNKAWNGLAGSQSEWQNFPSTNTPVNDTNLNRVVSAVDIIDNRVITLDSGKVNVTDNASVIKGVTLDDATGIFTFTRFNDSTFTINSMLEKVIVNFDFDEDTQIMTITLEDGTVKTVDLSSFIAETEVEDTSTIGLTLTNHVLKASVLANSIGDAQMQTGYLTNCQNAATTSSAKSLEAEGFAVGQQNGIDVDSSSEYYHNNAKYYAQQSSGQFLSALQDVSLSTLSDGQSLVYDATSSKWVNGDPAIAVIDNLTSTDSNNALSANQGRVLNEKINGIILAGFTPTNESFEPEDQRITICWTDPSDVMIGSATLATWSGTKLVRKTGSAPTSETDGTVVCDSKNRSEYATNGYVDSGLTNGVTYYYGIFPYTTTGLYNYSVTGSETPAVQTLSIYLDIEGAKNDHILIKQNLSDADEDAIQEIYFTSGATSEEDVFVEVPAPGTYYFVSKVAKSTTDPTQDYTKSVTLSQSSNHVYVFPSKTENDKSNMLYWYGNEFVENTGGWSMVGTSTNVTLVKNTNAMVVTTGSESGGTPSWQNATMTTNKIVTSGYTKIKFKYSYTNTATASNIGLTNQRYLDDYMWKTFPSATPYYVAFCFYRYGTSTVSAIWLE